MKMIHVPDDIIEKATLINLSNTKQAINNKQ
jgi:hypothetical protein